MIHILHLSDLHLGTREQSNIYRIHLETDLIRELNIQQLDYVVISGDIANKSTPQEYEAAFQLIDGLICKFGLNPEHVIVAPGNHDLNWDISAEAYQYVLKSELSLPYPEGKYIAGGAGVLLRDDLLYEKRFDHFSEFYKKLYNKPYPIKFGDQGVVHFCTSDRILFLSLNSCWEIDHYYNERSGIHMEALGHAFEKFQDGLYDKWIKIAVWHHPVKGSEMMKNADFLQLLAVQGFHLCLHGHIHEATEGFYNYDARRDIHIIGAGTFGVPAREPVTGIPLQYNLLSFNPETYSLTVHTRRKEKPDGAWFADARWGDRYNPKPRYVISLNKSKGSVTSREMIIEYKMELVSILLECQAVQNNDTRNSVINYLPADMKTSIHRSPVPKLDVSNIVSRCLDFPDGINKLINAVRFFEGSSVSMIKLDDFVRDISMP